MKQIFEWTVLSSENPKEVSMTIKGILTMQVPVLLYFLEQTGLHVTDSVIMQYITIAVSWVGILLILVGTLRKLKNALKEKPKAKKK